VKRTILLLIGFFFIIVSLVACEQASTATVSDSTGTQTIHVPTAHPTSLPAHPPRPQSTPSYLQMTNGPTVLGVSVSNFFGKYGQTLITHDHGYTWAVDNNGNPYEMVGVDIHPDGIVYRVDVLNASGTNWSLTQSIQACSTFLPPGTNFDQQVDAQTVRYTSPAGEIQFWSENQEGDCMVQFMNTI
jgi:hypothetical protein